MQRHLYMPLDHPRKFRFLRISVSRSSSSSKPGDVTQVGDRYTADLLVSVHSPGGNNNYRFAAALTPPGFTHTDAVGFEEQILETDLSLSPSVSARAFPAAPAKAPAIPAIPPFMKALLLIILGIGATERILRTGAARPCSAPKETKHKARTRATLMKTEAMRSFLDQLVRAGAKLANSMIPCLRLGSENYFHVDAEGAGFRSFVKK
mmetsp:Transcript_15795/g.22089  ORF Transcript_15795/g.22089 Transcript_15795/m.22089 type:complete len:207 (-) Transcript_15795:43-663(-)